MAQHSMKINSDKKFIDKQTGAPFYFARIIKQDEAGKFIALPSCKVLAEAFDHTPVKDESIMVDCGFETETTPTGSKYLRATNAKILAHQRPSVKAEYDEDALASLLESEPF